ncbi:MAG: vitamin K epoxide reductase family protein [Phycisphaeraceae bacterium]
MPPTARSRPRPDLPAPAWLRWPVRLLACVAIGFTIVLLRESLVGGVSLPGCAPGSGCDEVLSSPWSYWLGVPVSGPALVVYASLLGASLHVGPAAGPARRRWAWWILAAAAFAAAASAVWFIIVQAWLLGAWCRYCSAVHGSGLAITLLVGGFWLTRMRRAPLIAAAGTGLAVTAVLVAGQWLFPSAGSRTVELHARAGWNPQDQWVFPLPEGGMVAVDPAPMPRLGPADAPVMLIELYDYTCPHCRILHDQLAAARDRYGKQMGVILLPIPLDAECNPRIRSTLDMHRGACELARIALAVWRADPDEFAAFDRWLFSDPWPRLPSVARNYARTLVGEDALAAALADPWVDAQLQRNITLYGRTGGGSVPKLVLGTIYLEGRPASAADLFELLEARTRLEPVSRPGVTIPDEDQTTNPRGDAPREDAEDDR